MQKIDDCKEIRLALTRAGIATCPEKCLQTFRLVVTAQYIYHKAQISSATGQGRSCPTHPNQHCRPKSRLSHQAAEAYPLHASMRCTSPHLMTSEGGVAHILAYTLATGQNVARRL
jgi:hypothetical protein